MTAEPTLAELADPATLRDRMVGACREVLRKELAASWTPLTLEDKDRFEATVDRMLEPWADSLPGVQRQHAGPLGERAVLPSVLVPVRDRQSTSRVLRMVMGESERTAVVTRKETAEALGVGYVTLSSWYRGSGEHGRTLAVEVLGELLGRVGWDLALVATRRDRRG